MSIAKVKAKCELILAWVNNGADYKNAPHNCSWGVCSNLWQESDSDLEYSEIAKLLGIQFGSLEEEATYWKQKSQHALWCNEGLAYRGLLLHYTIKLCEVLLSEGYADIYDVDGALGTYAYLLEN